jgi:hypothetical protein
VEDQVNLSATLSTFDEQWKPRVVTKLNDHVHSFGVSG